MKNALACAGCHEPDIPPVGWLWWHDFRGQLLPVHPWCDQKTWNRVSPDGQRQIKVMVQRVRKAAP